MVEPEVTVIIPVFNDMHSLDIAIPRSVEVLSRITKGFELIIAEDGSSDGSTERVRVAAKSRNCKASGWWGCASQKVSRANGLPLHRLRQCQATLQQPCRTKSP